MAGPKDKAKFQASAERAEGDGNCAYNAFVLGLSQSSVIDGIEKSLAAQNKKPDDVFAKAISGAAAALHIAPTWSAIKAELLKRPVDRQNKIAFQKKFAPLFRALSIDLLQDASNRDNSIKLLNIEYQNFVYVQLGVEGRQQGDFCRAHPIVQQKFAELFSAAKSTLLVKIDIAEYKKVIAPGSNNDPKRAGEIESIIEQNINAAALEAWWIKEGYNQFCTKMRDHGMHGGDLELGALANYFGVNLIVRGTGASESMRHSAHGSLVAPSNAIARALSDRKIARIDGDGVISATVELHELTLEEVKSRLGKLSSYDDVMAYLVSKAPKSGDEISASDFSSDCLAQLESRGVLCQREGRYCFAISSNVVEDRINKMDQADNIIAEWEKCYRDAPTIMLSNPNGVHWDNIPLVETVLQPAPAISALSEDEKTVNKVFDEYFDALEKANPIADPADTAEREAKIGTPFIKAFEKVHTEANKLRNRHGLFSIPKDKTELLSKALDEVIAETEKLKKNKP